MNNKVILPKIPNYGDYIISFSAIIGDPPAYEGGFAHRLYVRGYRSKRKTIKIIPHPSEKIELRLPNNFTLADTKSFVDANGQEILNKLNELLYSQYPYKPLTLTYDSTVPFYGRDVPIYTMADDSKGNGYFTDDAVYLKQGLTSDEIRANVLRLLGEMAYGVLKEKTDRYAKLMNTEYGKLEINDGRRTFGGYDSLTGNIVFSRRLLMMKEAVINSLVVHELAHVETLSHNNDLYDVIYKILPDYDEIDEEFNDSCGRLIKMGWL